MNVHQEFVQYSNFSYAAACLIYLIALLLSVYYYTLTNKRVEAIEEGTKPENPGKSHKVGSMAQMLIWLGIIFHAGAVIFRGLAVHRFPWGNLFEYISLITLVVMIVAAIILRKRDYWSLWMWILAPIIILMYYNFIELYVAPGDVVPALKSFWLIIHVSIVSVGAGFGMVSGIASILYLIRNAAPQGEEDGHGFVGWLARPLPSKEKLDSIAYRTAIWTIVVFGLGVITGAIWARGAWGRYWGWDPKETMSFITWILYAAYLHARATPGWRGVKASWINIIALATMIFNLFFINMVIPGLHSYSGLG